RGRSGLQQLGGGGAQRGRDRLQQRQPGFPAAVLDVGELARSSSGRLGEPGEGEAGAGAEVPDALAEGDGVRVLVSHDLTIRQLQRKLHAFGSSRACGGAEESRYRLEGPRATTATKGTPCTPRPTCTTAPSPPRPSCTADRCPPRDAMWGTPCRAAWPRHRTSSPRWRT